MNHPLATSSSRRARRDSVDSIEWEELPSLYESLTGRLALIRGESPARSSSCVAVWTETMPAAFDPLVSSGPFEERLQGLAMREVIEPDVFRHFFGSGNTTT